MNRRRDVEVFSLSFLDCICCGFGAIILMLVLTEVGQPIELEKSRANMQGQVRLLEQQLQVIRGETDVLERELNSREDTLRRERDKLARLSGDLTNIQGQYSASKKDASVTNIVEGELVAAQESLTSDMQRLMKERASRAPTGVVGGLPTDSEYVIFIIDTSSSMTSNHWTVNLQIVDEILSLYPQVKGMQVMNDQGRYMFSGSRGKWLNDTPSQRQEIRVKAREWRAFSQSNPVPGMEEAVRTYWSPEKRISVFVLGDEFTGDSIQAALDMLNSLNKPGRDGHRPIRIHAVGFPEAPDMAPFTNIRFSALMRMVCEQNNGTFVGMKQ
jgi:hypothetical protein